MKLLLTSAGLSTKAIRKKFLELVGKKPEDIFMAIVPTASDAEKDKGYVEKDKEVFRKMGIKIVNVDLKNKTEEELFTKFGQVDAIFVEGGNTFYLLYWVRKSGFDKVLPKILKQGKVYVGASAGSIIAGPSIETAGWRGGDRKDVVPLESLAGLGCVDFVIWPHIEKGQEKTIKESGQKLAYELVPLTDKQAVVVENSTHEII